MWMTGSTSNQNQAARLENRRVNASRRNSAFHTESVIANDDRGRCGFGTEMLGIAAMLSQGFNRGIYLIFIVMT